MIAGLPWKYVVIATSALSALGGITMLLAVRDGPYRKPASRPDLVAPFAGFRNRAFRAAAFGYFGHMWELYAFWAAIPLMLTIYNQRHPLAGLHVPLLSFGVIASGRLACVIIGYLAPRFGAKRIAMTALALSGLCCVLSPLFLLSNYPLILILFLFFWALVVVADSPLFSTLIAQAAPQESRGTALTIVTCIGFSVNIVSIQLINGLSRIISMQYVYVILAVGPALGRIALLRVNDTAGKNGRAGNE